MPVPEHVVYVDDFDADPGPHGDAEANDDALDAALQALYDLPAEDRENGGCVAFSAGIYNLRHSHAIRMDRVWLRGCRTVLRWKPTSRVFVAIYAPGPLEILPGEGGEFSAGNAAGADYDTWLPPASEVPTLQGAGLSALTLRCDPPRYPDCFSFGLQICNGSDFQARSLSIEGFTVGIAVSGSSRHNDFELIRMSGHVIGAQIGADGEDTTQGIVFRGGRWSSDAVEAFAHVLVKGSGTSDVHFTEAVFEAGPRYGMYLGSRVRDVSLLACRLWGDERTETLVGSEATGVSLLGCHLEQADPEGHALSLARDAGVHTLLGTSIVGELDDHWQAVRGIYTLDGATRCAFPEAEEVGTP
jgi:hypothetical protein